MLEKFFVLQRQNIIIFRELSKRMFSKFPGWNLQHHRSFNESNSLQDDAFLLKKKRKEKNPSCQWRPPIRSSAIRSRDFLSARTGDCRRRMTAQVILSIPTSKKVYRLARLDERIQPTNDPAARRSLSSTSSLCWIYLYEAPAGNAPVKAYGDTFHARHGTFTSSLFQAAHQLQLFGSGYELSARRAR